MLRRLTAACAIALAFQFVHPLRAADLKPASRMAIVRGLVAETATVLAPLPRGEKGLRVSAEGGIDREGLGHEILQEGTAVPSKSVVQITAIQFHDKDIVFEINGGSKKKSKWYEHIEVGIGSQTTPISNPNAEPGTQNGSKITLLFPRKLPDMTVDEIKDYLALVLDFEAKSPVLATPTAAPIPPEFQKAIEEKQAIAGMTQDMVLAALGQPDRKVREERDGAEQEDWIYGTPPLKVTFVTFEGDQVVDVQEYKGGVRGEIHPYPTEPPR
jgi:hypothetical protein